MQKAEMFLGKHMNVVTDPVESFWSEVISVTVNVDSIL